MSFWQKTIAVISTFALLINSLAAPLTVLAQEATPTPTPEVTISPTDTATPTVTPDTTPAETATPTPEITPVATDLVTPPPSDQPATTQAPESNPTTQGPPSSDQPTSTPTITPEAPVENGHISAAILQNTKVDTTTIDQYDLTYQTDGSAVISTDKLDYAPTDSVLITGVGFIAHKIYEIVITSSDTPAVNFSDSVKANSKGEIVYSYQLDGTYRPNYQVAIKDLERVVATTTFTDGNEAANLDQCRNGSVASPSNCVDSGSGSTGWVNGNAGDSDSHYAEGYSIPYRTVMTNLPTGTTITLDLGYDIKHSDHNAIDYLTHYNRLEPHTPFGHSAETIDPTSGVSGVSGTTTTYAIPAPSSSGSPVFGQPTTSFNNLLSGERVMTLFGGTISNVSYVSQGSLSGTSSETVVRVTFNVNSSTAVLAWGGHIASRLDWGFVSGSPRSAGGINGSPYHMRLKDWSLSNLGNQDRSLSAGAVITPSNITIHKVTSPAGGSGFGFTTAGGILPSTFTLNDGGSQNFSATPGNYSVSENNPSPQYALSNLVCSASGTGTSATPDIGNRTVSIVIGAGGNGTVDCTFTNTLQQGSLKIVKMTTGGDATFDYNIAGPSAYTTSVITSGGTGLSGPTSVKSGTTYAITESQPADWNFGSAVCDKAYTAGANGVTGVTVLAGQLTTCTFSNTKVAKLTVHKTVLNHGLIYDTTHFAPYKVGSTEVTLDQANVFNVGAYTVSETADSRYTTTFSGACDSQGNVTLAAGDNKTCNITNEEKVARLTVNKVVIDHGLGFGTSHFAPYQVGSTTVTLGVSNVFNSGSYTVTEAGDTRYTATFSGSCDADGLVTLNSGDDKTCTITNEEKPSKVVVYKIVTNHGLTNDATHFAPYKVGTTTVTLDAETVMNSGNYIVSEATDPNYIATFTAGDCNANGNITLIPGTTKSCTITNEEIPTHLIVQKIVRNHGLTYDSAHFAPYTIDGNTVTLGASNTVNSGTRTVGEATDSDYNQTFSSNCEGGSITLAPGDTKTCTITNEEKTATITVHKIVTNHGLTNGASHFAPYKVGSTTVTLDAVTPIDSGVYTVSEKTDSNYTATFKAGDCDENGLITVTPGSAKSCTITNEEIPTYLTVTKTLRPEGDPGLFNLQIDGVTSGSGFNVANAGTTGKILVDSSSHTVGETAGTDTNLSNYSSLIGGGCASDGTVTLSPGEDVVCTITNTRKVGYLLVNKLADTGNGKYDSLNSSSFTWGTDSKNTSSLMGQTATLNTGNYNVYENTVPNYKFTGWFWGNPEGNVSGCDNPEYTTDPTNIAVYSNETTEITLCNRLQNPQISITKINDSSSGINAGSAVTYTLTITNNGNIDLHNVLITDFLPGGFTYVNGSSNGATFINAIGPKLTWTLDNLDSQSSATITYQVTTDSGLTDGDYKNFATCQARYGEGSSISCDQVNSTVKIGHGISYGGSLGGQVLGISTELPATGSPTAILIIALGLLTAGFILKKYAKK